MVYLAEVITRIVQADPKRDIDNVIPWLFETAEDVFAAVASRPTLTITPADLPVGAFRAA